MPQNLISISIDAALAAELNGAVDLLNQRLADKTVGLDPDTRRGLLKMGDKSEAFVRQTMTLLAQNRQVVPPSLQLDEALGDLAALDVIRPLLGRLQQLVERLRDTEMALGSDLMVAGTEGYALLKVSGKGEALKGARRELSARFAKGTRAPEPVVALAE